MERKIDLIEEEENQFFVIHKSEGDYSMDIHFPYTSETKSDVHKTAKSYLESMSKNLHKKL